MNSHELKEKKPLATYSGAWDGLRSDKLLVMDKNGGYHVVRMYEGFLDGSEFCEFYDGVDTEIKDVVKWSYIDPHF